MNNIWEQFKQWMLLNYEAGLESLRAPVSDSEIDQLESKVKSTLPKEFSESLKIHNGQDNEKGWLFMGEEYLSTSRIIDEWNVWNNLLTEGTFEGIESEPEEGIKNDWWNPKWIPFTYDGSGNHLCIDLDPGENGTVGQIIRIWHDEETRSLEAGSFKEWFETYIQGILEGHYIYSEDYNGIVSVDDI